MARSTADEFASLLGLSKGLDAKPAKVHGPTNGDKASAILIALNSRSDLAESFWNELGASYLPCFLRTYFQTPFVLTEEDEDTLIFWIDMTIWAGNLILVSACPRFVRDHPDEARSFYLILTERAANLPQWVYNNNHVFPRRFFPHFLTFVRVFSQILAVHLPEPGLPPLSFTTRKGFTEMAVRVLAGIPGLKAALPATAYSELAQSGAHCYALASSTAKEDLAGFKTRLLANKGGTVWWGCEYAKNKFGMGERECSRLGGREEMKACSRCLSIRYCSREHQKAHWKIHKTICFQPSW
ncbi:hypothetical protein BDY24DRAFT_395476 [Mrakia frigida]|uniref:zinc finger MYND domain-containing protein n=1 Tax=Mrakia frigida TaxID=29902 RepID=UPI003FCBFC66